MSVKMDWNQQAKALSSQTNNKIQLTGKFSLYPQVMKKIIFIFSFLFILLNLTPVQGQTDTEFWFAVPKVTQGHDWGNRKFFFRFANLNLANTITISMPANPGFDPIIRNLAPNQAETVDVTALILQLWTENPNEAYNRGIKITATNLTTAYFEVGTNNNPDIFALKGRNALGKDFYVPFQDHFFNGVYSPRPYSGIYVVATEDQTVLTITPTKKVFPGRPAGVKFQVTLNMGQTFAIVPDDYANTGQLAINHLGGTRVESNKPIAISTSDDSVGANPYGGCRDLIGDQIVPTTIIGTEYVAMRGRLGQGGSATMPEFFYVLGTQPNTQVFIDGILEKIVQPGEQFRWQFTKQTHHIKTSEPTYVYHVAGFGCEMGGAILPPINVCTGSTKVSFTRSKGESFFLNILVRAGAQDGFIFNGNGPNTVIKASDFVAIPGTTDWLAAEYQMNATQVPVYQASLIENVKDVFHLGIINGGPSTGTMYGYFSDFNELNIRANISGTGALHKACLGDPIQLVARGGVKYQWSPPDYLDDPTSATPIALPDSSIKYTVTVSGACKMRDSTTVSINLYGPANAAFTVAESEGCSPFNLKIVNESYGITRYSWRMGDGTVYTTAAKELNHIYINNTDSTITRKLHLVGLYSLCRDEMETYIKVHPAIKAKAQPDITVGCSPLMVNFTNLSTGADQFLWKFGDGSTSNKKDPSYEFHNFTHQEKIFTVELTAISRTGCISDTTIQITVKPFIETGFDFTPPTHCSPYPVQLSNTSFGAVSNQWSFNGGSTFENIPQKQFTRTLTNNGNQPDTIGIWLISENSFGCRDTLTRSLVVYPAIKAEFSSDVTEGCNPLPVHFNNTSTGAKTYLWDFDKHIGNSSEQAPVVMFSNPSLTDTLVFNIKLTTTSEYFCTDEIQKQVRVYPRIEAGFTFDYTSYCTPQEITFHNNSLGAHTYSWNFGDGKRSSSSDEYVLHQFINQTTNEISHPIELVIENASGCKDTIVREVTIYPQVKADFNLITRGCHPLEVTLDNKSAGAKSILWTFGDGGNSTHNTISRIYTNTSHLNTESYSIRLVAESQFGCKDSLDKQVIVLPKPLASYAVSKLSGCAPLQVDLTHSSVGASSFRWDFGDGNDMESTGNVAHTYENNSAAAVTFISRLIVENDFGCTDTVQRGTEVFPAIKAELATSDIIGCHPLVIDIMNHSNGASGAKPYQWSFGDGNQSTSQESIFKYTFENFSHNQLQHYTMKLNAESAYGCKDSTLTTITVLPKPRSVFEPLITEGCSPLTVSFNDQSLSASNYKWYFGDGTSSGQQGNVTHVFHQAHDQGAGHFPIGLLVKNEYGCADSTFRQITVYPDITADFESTTEGCHPLNVSFNNLSLGANTLNWTFGDGSVSSKASPTYTYTNESHVSNKYYTVNLNTSSVFGCTANISKLITVHPKPKSAFNISVAEGCAPLLVEINNLSVGGTGFEWTLGNQNSTESQRNFGYTFANQHEAPQIYDLHLKTLNDFGCSRESTQKVLVYPEVKADFGADNGELMGCNPLNVDFANNSERAHKYFWDFGDGNSSTITKPSNKFFTPGTQESVYNIKLRAQSVYGCKDSTVHQARVLPVPMADMFVSPHAQIYPSTNVRVENLSAPGNWTFQWNMGDGRIITTDKWDTLDHEYIWPAGDYATRQYTVSLKTANEYCHDSISQKIMINAPMPMVGFEPASQGCPPLDVQFRNDSQYGLQFFWDFDDGTFSNLENPAHIFTKPGEYRVKLLVSGEGGLDSAYQTIKVFELPKADFRVASQVVQLPYESVQMVNLSSLSDYYEWHMGDGTIYTEFEPNHKYEKPGNYDIRLNVATNTTPQCFDSSVKASAVVAEQNCQLIFPDAFTPNTSGPSDGRYVINDPANHVFYPIHTGIKSYEMEIYNRWGEFLFRTTDIDVGWDGYYRGKLSAMDVFVWKAKATCHSGREIKIAGDVTLYR
jgi:PKD repeat protein